MHKFDIGGFAIQVWIFFNVVIFILLNLLFCAINSFHTSIIPGYSITDIYFPAYLIIPHILLSILPLWLYRLLLGFWIKKQPIFTALQLGQILYRAAWVVTLLWAVLIAIFLIEDFNLFPRFSVNNMLILALLLVYTACIPLAVFGAIKLIKPFDNLTFEPENINQMIEEIGKKKKD